VELLQGRFVRGCGLLGPQSFRRDGMDIRGRNGDARQERFERHPIITVRMIMRHEALVTPEPMRATPGKARRKLRIGKMPIKPLGRQSTRQANREPSGARDCKGAQPLRHMARQQFGIVECARAFGWRHGTTPAAAALALCKINVSIALAKPSLSLVPVTRSASACTSGLALPIATLSPPSLNIATSLPPSPITATSAKGTPRSATISVSAAPLLASGWVMSR